MLTFLRKEKLESGDIKKNLQNYLHSFQSLTPCKLGDYVVFKNQLMGLVPCPAKYGMVMEFLSPRGSAPLGEFKDWKIATVSSESPIGVYLISVDSRLYDNIIDPACSDWPIPQTMEIFDREVPITPDISPGTFVRFRHRLLKVKEGFYFISPTTEKVLEPDTPLIVISSDAQSVRVAGYFSPTEYITEQTRKHYELCKLIT